MLKLLGDLIIDIYQGNVDISFKGDGSRKTLADQIADDLIRGRLNKLTPQIPVISEGSDSLDPQFSNANSFWLVDTLDGTKEFIRKNGQFTMDIALIEHGQPVLGAVYTPSKDYLYA